MYDLAAFFKLNKKAISKARSKHIDFRRALSFARLFHGKFYYEISHFFRCWNLMNNGLTDR